VLSKPPSRLQRATARFRAAAERGGGTSLQHRFRILRGLFVRSNAGNALLMRLDALGLSGQIPWTRTYSFPLPVGLEFSTAQITLSVPALAASPVLEFAEHVADESGRATDSVLATFGRGFALSNDLGANWTYVRIQGWRDHRVIHIKAIGHGEFLIQAVPSRPYPSQRRSIALLVVDRIGRVLAANRLEGSRWHGCRSVDIAGDTLMYAEYPYDSDNPFAKDRFESRVFRSRDRGRSWQIVRTDNLIRHYHFLQARPGTRGEWWLTSGDEPGECQIWVSRDDGDTWLSLTDAFGDSIAAGTEQFRHKLFRLTDLAWQGNEVVWGTDDCLRPIGKGLRGARVVRSPAEPELCPEIAGRTPWEIRNLVDLGDAHLFLTQGCARPDLQNNQGPGVFLLPKRPGAELVHLFDVDVHSVIRTGFTYSRASRVAKDGVFFTFRTSTDAFPFGHKILKWEVSLA
jgi:hypothetical protein